MYACMYVCVAHEYHHIHVLSWAHNNDWRFLNVKKKSVYMYGCNVRISEARTDAFCYDARPNAQRYDTCKFDVFCTVSLHGGKDIFSITQIRVF